MFSLFFFFFFWKVKDESGWESAVLIGTQETAGTAFFEGQKANREHYEQSGWDSAVRIPDWGWYKGEDECCFFRAKKESKR